VDEQAKASAALLGWLYDDDLTERTADLAEPETAAAVIEVATGADMWGVIREATGNRVATEILTPTGLYAVRWLAGLLVDDKTTPADALDTVLQAMWTRGGCRPG